MMHGMSTRLIVIVISISAFCFKCHTDGVRNVAHHVDVDEEELGGGPACIIHMHIDRIISQANIWTAHQLFWQEKLIDWFRVAGVLAEHGLHASLRVGNTVVAARHLPNEVKMRTNASREPPRGFWSAIFMGFHLEYHFIHDLKSHRVRFGYFRNTWKGVLVLQK